MSSVYSYPGVYIKELPSPVHSITAVATSIAAFVGYTARGIDNRAQAIYSFADFQRLYGGLASNSELSYAVQQFFQNGGSQAYVVRTPGHYNSALAVKYATVSFGGLVFSALSSGAWANEQLLLDVDVIGLNLSTTPPGDLYSFNLTVTNLFDGTKEYFPGLTLNSASQNFVANVVNDPDNGSQLVSVNATSIPTPPTTALVVTGILGAPLPSTPVTTGSVTVKYLEGVNTDLSTSPTTTTASTDCYISLTLPTSVFPTALSIKVLAQNAPIPQTVAGLASQLQQAVKQCACGECTGRFGILFGDAQRHGNRNLCQRTSAQPAGCGDHLRRPFQRQQDSHSTGTARASKYKRGPLCCGHQHCLSCGDGLIPSSAV